MYMKVVFFEPYLENKKENEEKVIVIGSLLCLIYIMLLGNFCNKYFF